MTPPERAAEAVQGSEAALDAALGKAVDSHFDGMPPADVELDAEFAPPAQKGGADQAVVGTAETEGQADEAPPATDGTEGGAVEGEGDQVTAGESDLEQVTDETAEGEEDLTPRDEEGKFTRRFTSIDPSTLPPELVPTYKSMQADYTRKGMELASERRELQQTQSQIAELHQQLSTTEGIAQFITEAWEHDPRAFDAARERIEALTTDPRELEMWKRERAIERRERDQRVSQRNAFESERERVVSAGIVAIQAVESETGIPFDTIEEFVAAKISAQQARGETVTEADVTRIVNEFAGPVRARIKGKPGNKATDRTNYVKNKAAQAKATPRPKSSAAAPIPKPAANRPKGFDNAFEAAFERGFSTLKP